ncbi:MAG TPA: ATP-binding cassette domain-containing protein [Methylosinus sp.]|jgi:ABC-type multidrug transport system ATPase subunit
MLQARELSKRYAGRSDRLALDRLNLNAPGGEVFCLLGPNGAGKTTTVNLLVETLRKQGMAILMVTHDLFLAKQCGTRICVMQAGRLTSVFGADDVDHAGVERAYLELFRGAAA